MKMLSFLALAAAAFSLSPMSSAWSTQNLAPTPTPSGCSIPGFPGQETFSTTLSNGLADLDALGIRHVTLGSGLITELHPGLSFYSDQGSAAYIEFPAQWGGKSFAARLVTDQIYQAAVLEDDSTNLWAEATATLFALGLHVDHFGIPGTNAEIFYNDGSTGMLQWGPQFSPPLGQEITVLFDLDGDQFRVANAAGSLIFEESLPDVWGDRSNYQKWWFVGDHWIDNIYATSFVLKEICFRDVVATFPDVPVSHWAWRYVEGLFNGGLTAGYPDGTYRPDNPVTRAEMAVFLKKGIHGSSYTPPAPNGSSPFSDLAGHWAEPWMEELYDEGLTVGYPDGTYRPENQVTRAEMAVFLLKAEHGSSYVAPVPSGGSFSDVAGHWAESWIEQLKEEGITSGYPDGTFRPENNVTRAEMAVFLVQTFNLPAP